MVTHKEMADRISTGARFVKCVGRWVPKGGMRTTPFNSEVTCKRCKASKRKYTGDVAPPIAMRA